MKRMIIVLGLAVSIPAYSKLLAVIGGEQISDDDVNRFKTHLYNSGAPREMLADEDLVLDYIINMKLAVLESKSSGLDQTEEAKDAMEGALYNFYLSKTVDSKLRNKKYSKQEILNYYKKYPVIKMNRIALPFNPSSDSSKRSVFSKMSLIRADLQNKSTTFEALIEQYSKNDPTTLTGTFDKMPIALLSAEEKQEASNLKPMTISSILAGPNYFSLIRVVKVYPISSGDYGPINEILKANAVTQARTAQIRSLRQKYSSIIEIK